MTLLQLTEPLFQYICRLNRIARRAAGTRAGGTGDTTFITLSREAAQTAAPVMASQSGGVDYAVSRSEIKGLIEDMMANAAADIRLSQQARKVELPLIFFIDSMISESVLPFAAEWNQNRLAYDRQELAGDEKFFDLLDETLKDLGEDAAERLAVFYTCIGLGFTGIYFKQPEFLRKTMLTIAPRVRHLVENDQNARICPDAYEAVDTRNLVQPPSSRMVIVGLAFAGIAIAVVISYFIIYHQASTGLTKALDDVREHAPKQAQLN
jgi:type VI secretion system protein ImpK